MSASSAVFPISNTEIEVLPAVFRLADVDRDGRVGRHDAQVFFARFGLDQRVLALVRLSVHRSLSCSMNFDQQAFVTRVFLCMLLAIGFARSRGFWEKLWELCDTDQNGLLDRSGLCLALRSVYLLKQSNSDVSVLTRRAVRAMNLDWPSLFTFGGLPREPRYEHNWPLVARYYDAYRDCEVGLSGARAAAVLRKSRLSDAELARVWTLADRDRDRLLNFEEFALALWLVSERVANPFATELPTQLSDRVYIDALLGDRGEANVVAAARYDWLGAVPPRPQPASVPPQAATNDATLVKQTAASASSTTSTTIATTTTDAAAAAAAASTTTSSTAITATSEESKPKRKKRRDG